MATHRKKHAKRHGVHHGEPPGIGVYWLRSFISIALALLVSMSLLAGLWVVRVDRDELRQLAVGTGVLAANVSAEVAHIRARIDRLRSDPALRAAFLARRADLLAAQEHQLLSRLPDAQGIFLVAPEQVSSPEGIPFMSHAGLDLTRQAIQDRATTRLEVHKVGQDDMHLAVAAPVLDESGAQVIGVLHVTFPMSLLPSTAAVPGVRGTLYYQQVVGDELATFGLPAGAAVQAPDRFDAIDGSRLRVAGWRERTRAVDLWLLGGLGGVYAVSLALIGRILRRGYLSFRHNLLVDLRGLVGTVESAIRSRPPAKMRWRFLETRKAHRAIFGLLTKGAAPQEADELRPDAAAPAHAREESPWSKVRTGSDSTVEVEELEAPLGSDIYSIDEASPPQPAGPKGGGARKKGAAAPLVEAPAEIFGAYDIRGLAGTQLTPGVARAIGRALGSEAIALGDRTAMVGRDCRPTSPALAAALREGLQAAGMDVVDLGIVPTPLVYFACCHPEPCTGAMVTASHNPPEYNGVKAVLDGVPADAGVVQRLRERISTAEVASGKGGYRVEDVVDSYREYVVHRVALARSLKVVVDCGKATAAVVAPELFRALGCEVVELNCEMETGLGVPSLNPSRPEAMQELGEAVVAQGADLGLAFDFDGDRLGVVDAKGAFIAADRVLMLLAVDVLSRHPGSDVVFDVKCSRHLAEEIHRAGGRPVMIPSGHAPLKARARETGAPIAGELSGHIVFNERWFGFDDAIYAGARLLEVLSLDPRSTEAIFSALPGGQATPELELPLPPGEPARLMGALAPLVERLDGWDLIRIDGIRLELDRSWGLVRASNTESQLVFRFEGDDQASLERVQSLFRSLMSEVAPGLSLPF